MSDEIGDRESALQQQYQELLDQTKRKLQSHEVTIQRLTSTLADKEQQLQVTKQHALKTKKIFHQIYSQINFLPIFSNFIRST